MLHAVLNKSWKRHSIKMCDRFLSISQNILDDQDIWDTAGKEVRTKS